MKTLKLVSLFFIIFLLSNYTAVAQVDDEDMPEEISNEVETITATYNGYDSDTYDFSYSENGEDYGISFNKLSPEVEKMYDLKSKNHIGKTFQVIYSTINEEIEDVDGETIYSSVKTILSLK